jgi:hypothetical protein
LSQTNKYQESYLMSACLNKKTTGITKRMLRLQRIGFREQPIIRQLPSRCIRLTYPVLAAVCPLYYRYTQIFERKAFVNDTRIKPVNGFVHLSGYWQTVSYPMETADILASYITQWINSCRERLEPEDKQPDLNTTKMPKNAISLHVRKGDYSGSLIVCSDRYYQNAVSKMEALKGSKDLLFYIHSDDIGWCKENLTFPGQKFYVDNNGDELADFKSMLRFENFIISNSSYSWWPAFLSAYHSKIAIVCAPEFWWTRIPVSTIDIYPSSWNVIRIKEEK